jgi:hypothetical protein
MAVLFSACGSIQQVDIADIGDMVVQDYDLSGFDSVEVSDFFEVEIRLGEIFDVIVEAENALRPYLDVVVRGKTLQIGLKSGYSYNIENASHSAEVTLPELARVEVGNHSNVGIESYESSEDLEFIISNFSSVTGEIEVSSVRVDVSNHSTLRLSGTAQEIRGEASNFSTVNLTDLDVDLVDVSFESNSTLKQ